MKMLIMKRRKREKKPKGIELPNEKRIGTHGEKKNLLGNIGSGHHQTNR